VGRAYLHKDTNKKAIFAGYLIRFLIDELKADPDYIFYYCHSIIYKFWVEAIHRPAVRILVIVNTSLVHALD
jgi:type I restriction enzyme S subunit